MEEGEGLVSRLASLLWGVARARPAAQTLPFVRMRERGKDGVYPSADLLGKRGC